MNLLINCSNLKVGGGLQVADSVCRSLNRFSQHKFVVVLSAELAKTREAISEYANIKTFCYDIKNNISTLFFGRDKFLDCIVKNEQIKVVITIFGPSRWIPKCTHLCGFARSHLVLPHSPYFQRLKGLEWVKIKIYCKILECYFRRSSKYLYTENPYISKKLQNLIPESQVFTVTNYYNQIYDLPEKWKQYKLPDFHGITLLTITAPYPHKNLSIMKGVAEVLKNKYSDIDFRFVLTIDSHRFPIIPDSLKKHFLFIGKVDISECPSLYRQADVMFQPTLLECFTATYPEAMRMEVPIVTTDLEFARGLCCESALYYEPLNAEAAADAIYKIVSDNKMRINLIEKGLNQLKKFDTYNQRAEKLISIAEQITNVYN